MRKQVLAAYYFWGGKSIDNLFMNFRKNNSELIIYMAEIMQEFQKYRIEPTKEMLVHAVLVDLKTKG